jgi:hypothetical protein
MDLLHDYPPEFGPQLLEGLNSPCPIEQNKLSQVKDDALSSKFEPALQIIITYS